MATIKLSKSIKDQIRSRAVDELYGEKIRCAQKDLENLVTEIVLTRNKTELSGIIPNETISRIVEDGWIHDSQSVIISVYDSMPDRRAYNRYLDLEKPVILKRSSYRHTLDVDLRNTTDPVVMALRKIDQIAAKKDSFDGDLYDVLLSVTSVKQLQEVLPQMVKYLPAQVTPTSLIPLQKLERIKSQML